MTVQCNGEMLIYGDSWCCLLGDGRDLWLLTLQCRCRSCDSIDTSKFIMVYVNGFPLLLGCEPRNDYNV